MNFKIFSVENGWLLHAIWPGKKTKAYVFKQGEWTRMLALIDKLGNPDDLN